MEHLIRDPSTEIVYFSAVGDFSASPFSLVCNTMTISISFWFDSQERGTLSWGPTALHLASFSLELQKDKAKSY